MAMESTVRREKKKTPKGHCKDKNEKQMYRGQAGNSHFGGKS